MGRERGRGASESRLVDATPTITAGAGDPRQSRHTSLGAICFSEVATTQHSTAQHKTLRGTTGPQTDLSLWGWSRTGERPAVGLHALSMTSQRYAQKTRGVN